MVNLQIFHVYLSGVTEPMPQFSDYSKLEWEDRRSGGRTLARRPSGSRMLEYNITTCKCKKGKILNPLQRLLFPIVDAVVRL